MVITGIVCDVGKLYIANGVAIEEDGRRVEITGLTEDECREFAAHLGEAVKITVEKA